MTQGELEKLALKTGNLFAELEIRIMSDIARRIHDNGFSTASADWQMTRLQQLGMAESEIKAWIKETLQKTDAEMEYIFSDEVYKQYYQHSRAYKVSGMQQIPFERNTPLRQLTQAVKKQLSGEYENLAASMGFAIRGPDGRIQYSPLMEFYRSTLDNAVLNIQSGAFSYETVLQRTVSRMTASGVRWVDYDSGVHNRIDVAARRAVLTGFRQVQALINEQTAADLGTDSYEVSYHVGARPSHQPWEGRVWTKEELVSVCGLGDVTGLCGANCYHDYLPFIPGVSVRTYTDEQLQEMIDEENTPKEYYGKQYTTYEALQEQRRREQEIRATRQQVRLLQEGGADEKAIILKKARYQGQLQNYVDFSRKMGLPEQKQRILQDGLRGRVSQTKEDFKNITPEAGITNKKSMAKAGKVDLEYINSKQYKNKFSEICDNPEANSELYKNAKAMLTHRNGTAKEDLYLINKNTGQTVGSVTGSQKSYQVEYTDSVLEAIQNASPGSLISIHNHPTNIPPSGADFASAGYRKYAVGVVACHNGEVYVYKTGSRPFTAKLFDDTVEKYRRNGYNTGIDANIKALEQFEKDYGIKWRKL